MSEAVVQAWLDQEDRHTTEIIRKHGCYLSYVGGGAGCPGPCHHDEEEDGPEEGPSFCYTTGLFGLGHPELLIWGVTMETAAMVLNGLTARIRDDGGDLTPGEVVTLPTSTRRYLVEELPDPGAILFAANRFYQRPPEFPVPAYQLTWTDAEDHFPWDPGYRLPPDWQPRPGTATA